MILHVNLDIIDNNDDYLCFAWKLKPNHSFDGCLKRHSSEIHCGLSANNCFFHVMKSLNHYDPEGKVKNLLLKSA